MPNNKRRKKVPASSSSATNSTATTLTNHPHVQYLKSMEQADLTALFRLYRPVFIDPPKKNMQAQIQQMAVYQDYVAAYMLQTQTVRHLYGTATGRVIMSGSNEVQQLGLPVLGEVGPTEHKAASSTGRAVRRLACGGAHTLALTVHGDVLVWGLEDDGIVGPHPSITVLNEGTDDQVLVSNPVTIRGFVDSRTGQVEDGTAIMVAAGVAYSLVLTKTGQVYYWGTLRDNQQDKYHMPSSSAKNDSDICGSGARPVHVPMPSGVMGALRIAASSAGSLCAAILEDKSLVTWGKCI